MTAATSDNVLGSPRFEPVRVLGEGGSGIVYEVRVRSGLEETGRKTVALKVLKAELAPSERERRRFLEEAERMQRLDAPGLVKLLEAGLLPDGRPYLAMPLLDGETLAARLRRGPVPAPTAMRWFDTLARAVHALHVAGMVHRDVKPENILVVDDAPVLLDFGIARDIDEETTTTTAEGRVRGTPAYMAPERFFGAPASVRSDVYELGVVLFTMLVGRLPWGSEKNVAERLNPASPRDAGADVSTSLATVILRALSTRPEKRPESAEELAREVAAAAIEPADPSRRTLDVEVEKPSPLETAATELAPAKAPPASASAAPAAAKHRATWAIVAGVGAAALGAAVAMRAMAGGAAAPAAVSASAIAPETAPAASASASASASAPASASASASAPGSASASASASARGSARAPSIAPRPSPPPAPATASAARFYEDRR